MEDKNICRESLGQKTGCRAPNAGPAGTCAAILKLMILRIQYACAHVCVYARVCVCGHAYPVSVQMSVKWGC